MATQGGARAVQLAGQIGALAVGMRADIVLYNLTAPRWVPLNDPVQHLVHVEVRLEATGCTTHSYCTSFEERP